MKKAPMNAPADEVRGVPLGEIAAHLGQLGLEVERAPDGIRFQGRRGPTEIRVLAPEEPPLDDTPMKAVVVARTRLPDHVPSDNLELACHLNRSAALGAFMVIDGKPWAVTRLTTYEGEDAWSLHAPLIAWAAAHSPDGLLPGRAAPADGRAVRSGNDGPNWPDDDFVSLEERFRSRIACTGDDKGFTAELSLRGGCGTAALGDKHTALLTMSRLYRHPMLGRGLHVMLEMPHRFERPAQAGRLAMALNEWEARPGDMVPHYGAWCVGHARNPAYTSFFPAELWREGFVVNIFTWMLARARLADGILLARGVTADLNGEPRESRHER